MTHVIAARDALELPILDKWEQPQNDNEVFYSFTTLTREVDAAKAQFYIRRSRRRRKFSVALDPAEKSKVRHHLDKIRAIIDESELDSAKKDALFKKLNELASEVDKERSALEAFALAVSKVADMMRTSAEGAKPWFELFQPIFEILGASKRKEEETQAKLPPPPERKRIEGPKKATKKPDLDDDIPF